MDLNFSTRQNKVARLIQKELSDIFQRNAQDLFKGSMISVTTVRISKDLSVARCYLSIFPSGKGEEILEEISNNYSKIRGELGNRIGKQVRIIPHLNFFIDDSLDYIDNINRLIKS
ncbi:MAG: 30S ribosome-binding factor RbfA [Bacteroidota bacterium]|nr:30S ribosome-binding factor RbfA [Bacteroidota bacterium]MDP4207166.1 30S ribosome-binding factor RbfA [Bacteroidota bacterium]